MHAIQIDGWDDKRKLDHRMEIVGTAKAELRGAQGTQKMKGVSENIHTSALEN